ncbi:hypothetical protein J2S56_000508 [Corynebacterium lowii]|nr:hypothetical protein [Corynebacterium lowii]
MPNEFVDHAGMAWSAEGDPAMRKGNLLKFVEEGRFSDAARAVDK